MWYDVTKTPMYMTAGVKEQIDTSDEFSNFIKESVFKYFKKDWGQTHEDDWELNNSAVENSDDRILAVYKHENYEDVFIITEHDRSVTTILFANEY